MNKPGTQQLTSKQLLLSLLAALIVGAGLTVLIILPAETGRDPVGLGKASGLTQLATPAESGVQTMAVAETETGTDMIPAASLLESETLYIAIDPLTTKAVVSEFGEPQPAVDGANIRQHPVAFRTETITINLDIDGKVEYKAIMDRGEVLLYKWASDGELYYDFHAHQETGDPNFFTRYAEGEGLADQGSIVAPYSGQHGWFWLNITDKPVTVSLTVSGYFHELVKIDLAAESY